ncbi:MAG TPA: PHP domain-containing protein, partial [Gemmatimonadaceae bacterium]|nr:PHP domain-containing protein [Gemmatimonadaceae bacterium]
MTDSDRGDAGGRAAGDAARVDLHAHTTASDGTATPERFAAAALAAGLAAVAVTDHDTVGAVAEVTRRCEGTGLRVVAGVELSVHDAAGKEVHLLGLHLSDLPRVERALASVREARVDRAMQIVARLNAIGVALDPQAVLDQAAGGAVGRPHIARALVQAGHATALQQAFDRWLGAGKPAYVEKQRLSIADGIALVHDAGGLAVYAHPGPDGVRERIEPLVALGLDGVEVRHPSHSAADIKRIRGIVSALDLVPSGGSDWHGASEGPRVLGC